LVTFSTSILAREPFTTDFEAERISEQFRLVRGRRSVLNSSVDHSDSRKGPTLMADPEGQDPGDAGLVFVAHNNHDPRCGRPPRVRNTDNPGLYYGYFENRYGEQFIFTFDRATGTGTVSGGDHGWGEPKAFTLGQLEEVVRDTQRVAAQVVGQVCTERRACR
jgi:hypothetical protein